MRARSPAHAFARGRRSAAGAAAFLALSALLPLSAAPSAVAQVADPAPAPAPKQQEPLEDKQARKEFKRQAKEAEKRQKNDPFKTAPGRTAADWYAEGLDRYEKGKYLAAREILLPLEDSLRARDIQEQVKLLIADTYFYQGGALNLAEALARYRTFLTFFPSSDKAEYAQFQVANSYFRQLGPADRDQSFTDSAIAEYERFLQVHPGSEWADEARASMLEAEALRGRSEFQVAQFYYKWENFDAAAQRLESVLRESPALPEREQALFMAAQSFYNVGDAERGRAYAARLAEDYPGSKYAGQLSSGRSSEKAMQKAAKRDRRHEKEAQRTARRQARRDAKRTRQIRKDTGLPARMPASAVVASPVEPGAEAGAPGAPAAPAAPASAAPSSKQARKDAAKAEKRAREVAEDAEKKAREVAEAARKAEKAEKKGRGEAEKAEKAEKKAREEAEKAEKKAKKQGGGAAE
jgi:outer membrane protein assembly factor BamD